MITHNDRDKLQIEGIESPMGNDTDHPVVIGNCVFTWVPLEMGKIVPKERQKDMQDGEKVSLGAQSTAPGTPAEPYIASAANKSGPTLRDISFLLKKDHFQKLLG